MSVTATGTRSCLAMGLAAMLMSHPAAAEGPTGAAVTQANYSRAETDRSFYNIAQQAGGVNRFFKIRRPTPLDQQTVVRMNKDTLYAGAIVDTSKGATLTIPEMPAGRYFSVLMVDNDHYTPGVIYTPGAHKLPQDTKYLALIVRIQLLHPDDPEDIALVNALQDRFVVNAESADPFPVPKWDAAALAALTAQYNEEFGKYDKYPDSFMGPRGQADDKLRHLAVAGAWGLFPNKDAIYINYNARLPAGGCYTADYEVPDNTAFWSITVYGADGYMKNENSILNRLNATMDPGDKSFRAYFGSSAACGDVPNRLDISDGWNFLMRVYRPGPSVLDGTYTLPEVQPVKG